MDPKLFVATKAFIVYNGRILILKESSQYEEGTNSGRYDVAGGRIKPGQKFDESLLREIKEETGLNVKIGKPFFVGEWRPVVNGEQWHIVGTFFECFADNDNVVLSEDHENFEWIDAKDYKKYNLIENLFSAFDNYLIK